MAQHFSTATRELDPDEHSAVNQNTCIPEFMPV